MTARSYTEAEVTADFAEPMPWSGEGYRFVFDGRLYADPVKVARHFVSSENFVCAVVPGTIRIRTRHVEITEWAPVPLVASPHHKEITMRACPGCETDGCRNCEGPAIPPPPHGNPVPR